jgi:autotransporter-associated beta strand protein
LFHQSNTGSSAMHLPDSGGSYLIWGDWITTQPSDGAIPATGTLAYITIDTNGAAVSDVPYTLEFTGVAANYAPPGFDTDFAGMAATTLPGAIIVTNLRDLTWNAGRDGDWTETMWDGLVAGYLACPNYTSRAIVNTPHVVHVSSAQEANQLTLSGGGRVEIGPAGALAITTTIDIQTGGVLSLADGAGLNAASIDLAAGTISGSGAVVPPVSIAGGILDAPLPSDTLTLLSTLSGSDGLTKTGPGTVTIRGDVALTGVSVIQAGTLRLEGIVSSFEDISGAGNLEVGGSASSLLSARSIATNSLRIGGASAYSPQPTGAPASVPEPSTAMLAIGVGLGLLFVFRRR